MPRIPLRVDEQIVAEIRRFGFTTVWKWIGVLIPLAVAAVYMFWLFSKGTIGILSFFALILIGIMGCISNYIHFHGTVLLITNYRMVDISKDGIIGRTISEVELGDIEDVVVRQRGIWRMMLNYGTLEIRIRGSKIRIDVEYVKRPIGVQRLINELKKQCGIEGNTRPKYSVAEIHKSLTELDSEDLLYLKKVIETRLKQLRG